MEVTEIPPAIRHYGSLLTTASVHFRQVKGQQHWKPRMASKRRIQYLSHSFFNFHFLSDGAGAAPAQRRCDPVSGLAPAFCNRCSCGCAGL